MKIHPATDIFPPMSGAEYEALRADIDANGLIEPIVRHKGKILDGRHRLKACTELRIRPRYFEYDGDDPTGYAVSLNLH